MLLQCLNGDEFLPGQGLMVGKEPLPKPSMLGWGATPAAGKAPERLI